MAIKQCASAGRGLLGMLPLPLIQPAILIKIECGRAQFINSRHHELFVIRAHVHGLEIIHY